MRLQRHILGTILDGGGANEAEAVRGGGGSRTRHRRLWGIHRVGNVSKSTLLWKDRDQAFADNLCRAAADSEGPEVTPAACARWLEEVDPRFVARYGYSLTYASGGWMSAPRTDTALLASSHHFVISKGGG
jgi:hypothetical protein